MQALDHALQICWSFHRVDLGQHWLCRGEAQLIDAGFIHARAVEVADELLGAAARPVGLARNIFQDAFQLFLSVLAGLPATRPPDHRRRNRIFRAPLAIGVLEKIGARICFLVDVAHLNAFLGGSLSEHCGAAEQQEKREFQKTHFYLFKIEISVEQGRAQIIIRKAYMSYTNEPPPPMVNMRGESGEELRVATGYITSCRKAFPERPILFLCAGVHECRPG